MQMLPQEFRAQLDGYQGSKDEVHWVKVLPSETDSRRVVVMVLMEMWIEILPVS